MNAPVPSNAMPGGLLDGQELALQARGLSLDYGTRRALDAVDLAVPQFPKGQRDDVDRFAGAERKPVLGIIAKRFEPRRDHAGDRVARHREAREPDMLAAILVEVGIEGADLVSRRKGAQHPAVVLEEREGRTLVRDFVEVVLASERIGRRNPELRSKQGLAGERDWCR